MAPVHVDDGPGAAMTDEPLFRRSATPDTGMLGKPAGVLTPEIIRAALNALWNPPALAAWPDDGLECIPVLGFSPSVLARACKEQWDREAWIQGIKDRHGLICMGDSP